MLHGEDPYEFKTQIKDGIQLNTGKLVDGSVLSASLVNGIIRNNQSTETWVLYGHIELA